MVDLARSDRLARRLAFEPVEHAAGIDAPAHRETLALDLRRGVRLTRTLRLEDGAEATLSIEGDDPADLLARLDAVPRGRQLRVGRGFVAVLDQRIGGRGELRLVQGSAIVAGLTVRLTSPTHGGRRADVALYAALDDPLELPDDLLAVLGWSWSRLDRWTERSARRWSGSVGLGRRAPDVDAERKLERAALHVATTLAEAPTCFHERRRGARWLFAFRRSIPLLVCIGLIAGALLFTKTALARDSVYRMLIFNLPPLLLVAFFCLREMPRIEWPTWPRRSRAAAWRVAPQASAAPAAIAPRAPAASAATAPPAPAASAATAP